MITVILIVLGLAFGSFINALVWRIHEQAEQAGKKLTQERKVYLTRLSVAKGRSMCPHCHHVLSAKDLIPVLSWLSLKGKCRYCHKPIGWQYPLVEVFTAMVFVLSYIFWPSDVHGIEIFKFIVWLAMLVGLIALLIYDLRWYLLPNRILGPLFGLAVLQLIVLTFSPHINAHTLLSSLWGLLIGGGIFYLLFVVSKGNWIGGGDVKLGAVLGLLVGGPLAAILLLFLASVLGTLLAIGLILSRKMTPKSRMPFGPFLILSCWFIYMFSSNITTWLDHRYLVL